MCVCVSKFTLPTSPDNELGGVNSLRFVQRPVIYDFKILIISDHQLSIYVEAHLDLDNKIFVLEYSKGFLVSLFTKWNQS